MSSVRHEEALRAQMPRERQHQVETGEGTQGTFTLPATLTRDLRHLEEAGLIERIQGFHGKGANLTPEGVEFTRELKEKVGKKIR